MSRISSAALPVGLLLVSVFFAYTNNVLAAPDSGAGTDNGDGFLTNWMETSRKAKEEQPHWITPLVTVTPRLEQEFRYDQSKRYQAKSTTLTNFGGGKGLELIPTENTEVIIGVPAYQVKESPNKPTERGWADETFLLKYRFLTANEESGNYIVTGFLGLSTPTGDAAFTTNHTLLTPTIAAGKGWGTRESGFDIVSTLGVTFPDGDQGRIGVPIVWNTAFQIHTFQYFWPEVEAQYTHWQQGPNDGKSQLIMTYGVIFGRFPLSAGSNLILGAGYQAAQGTSFSNYDRAWLGTARVTF